MSNENQNSGQPPELNPDEVMAAVDRVIGPNPATLSDAERELGSTEQQDEKPNPFDNPAYRHEAGEGWHPDGLNRVVLGAIIAREAIAGAVGDTRDEEDRDIIRREFKSQQVHVAELKLRFGIWDEPNIEDS